MKVICLLFCGVLLSLYSVCAQESADDNFNQRHLDVSVSLLSTDISEAYRVADSLVKVARKDEHKVKAYMLLAKLYENEGDLNKSLKNAMLADTISTAMTNATWQAITSGYLSTTFHRLGLLKLATHYLKKAETANDQQLNSKEKTLTKINILHERAIHSMEVKDFNKAQMDVFSAAYLIIAEDDDDKRAILIKATNDQLRGIIDFHLGNLVQADSLLNASLSKIGAIESNLQPYIYRALADVCLETGNTGKALSYLKQIEPNLKKSNVEDLRILTYLSWANYFEKTNNYAKALEFKVKAQDLQDHKNRNAIELFEGIIEDLIKSKETYRVQYKFTILVLILLLFVMGALFVIFKRHFKLIKKKKPSVVQEPITVGASFAKPEHTFFDMELPKITTSKPAKEKIRVVKNVNVSKDTEERLLQELIKQEQKLFFIEKNVTLQQLASDMGTNVRYVTYSLQKFRGKDFYNYIQSLRIEYIINQIRSSPDFLNMKLSYLADICGFSSSSKFSVAFKAVTGMPPSVFLHLARKDVEKNV